MTSQSVQTRERSVLGDSANRLLRRATFGIEYGQILVKTPSGQTQVFGRDASGPRGALHIHDWRFARRLLVGWDIGFAESYMAGEWSSPDLVGLLNIMCRNVRLDAPPFALGLLRAMAKVTHALNRNTRRGSRRNVAAHYDLGNAFYAHWLDESMTYSSALYRDSSQTLHAAQLQKLDRVLELLELCGREHVLEIGCGWGSLAARILERSDCSITGLTLSSEQLDFARTRLKRFEDSAKCELRLQDYRDADGTFERVVSVEMLEAVGESYWPLYFSRLRQRLSQNGIAVLQAITINEDHFDNYRKNPDFIQKYIFPGGMLPTVEILGKRIADARLRLVSSEFFGSSYARTLGEWCGRFHDAWPAIEELGFDVRFRRMWEYYLAYCQAGFEAGVLNVGLYKLTHA
jgi:cyclopropane-fatty-acyl-phospholipid synthase